MSQREKDRWDKADIILKSMGGFATAVAVALLGYFGSNFLKERETREENARLYAQIMSQREESDSTLRKDMFNSIISTFLSPSSSSGIVSGYGLEQKVLNLELLSLNFHDALHLAPLFRSIHREIVDSDFARKEDLRLRLEAVAKEVTRKQIGALEAAGRKVDATLDLEELQRHPEGIPVIDSQQIGDARFRLEVLRADEGRKELLVRLLASTKQLRAVAEPGTGPTDGPDGGSGPANIVVDRIFRVGFFDFPMVDNTRLEGGQRAAVILRNFRAPSAEVTLVFFPGSRASLKEKPYYDEVIQELQAVKRAKEARD